MKANFINIKTRYENELLRSIIPFWEKNGIDRSVGGFFNNLDRDGSVYDTEKYMWIQWRSVYTFASLYCTGYKKDAWLVYAKQGADFLIKHGKDGNGNYYFALNGKGEPSVAPYNIYSDCFAAMGCAALFKACGEKKYRAEAEWSMSQYIKRIDNPKGRWEKSLMGRKKCLTLGHFMILANLGYVLNECLATNQYENNIEISCTLVLNKFWNEEYQVLFENINPDHSFALDSCAGRHINPGHGLEAMWFILQFAEKKQNSVMIAKAARIIRALFEFGWDKKFGGLYYFMDVLGKPQLELPWDMKLWWVHNEAMVAALYAYYLTGNKLFFKWFKKTDRWSWKHFPDKKSGEWFAYLNRRGEVTHTLKGGKWKCFFHLPRYLLTCIGLFDRIT